MKVMVIGVGMQGKTALSDLMKNDAVTQVIAADLDVDALERYVSDQGYDRRVICEHVNVAEAESIDRLMRRRPDVVLEFVPVVFGDIVAAAAVRNGVNLINTHYTTPALLGLSEKAKNDGIIILPEFGLDPGIDLVLLGEAVRAVDKVEGIWSYGAGIPAPAASDNPIRYKVTWTLEGALKSYRRAGRLIRDGAQLSISADELFHPKHIHTLTVPGLGDLEAYPNGDAIKYAERLKLDVGRLDHLGRYAARWPGHCQFWRKMVQLHLLDDEPAVVDGVEVDRKRFLSTVIEPHIRLGRQEQDVALVRVEVVGRREGARVKAIFQVVDYRDLETGLTAMSRTVGFTAAVGADLIASGKLNKKGVLSPVTDIPYDLFASELRRRGVIVTSEIVPLP